MYAWLKPLLFAQDSEAVHHRATALAGFLQRQPLALAAVSAMFGPPEIPALRQTFWGVPFHSPLGLAAGFDKDLRLIRMMQALGFGFMEAGSVSAQASQGNPRPRLFRLPADEALVNRLGLNNTGIPALIDRLAGLPPDWPIGISVAKTHDPGLVGEAAMLDFIAGYRAVRTYGAYTCLNISCPNTADGKTFEEPGVLDDLLAALGRMNREASAPARPLLIKLSPDVDPGMLDDLLAIGVRHGVAGWVAGNTTRSRNGLHTDAGILTRIGAGGLSGPPVREVADALLAGLYTRLRPVAPEAVLIGVGGIDSAEAAWRKITLGASLLQVYTGLVYQGPGLIRRIQTGLANRLQTEGYAHINEVVGSALR